MTAHVYHDHLSALQVVGLAVLGPVLLLLVTIPIWVDALKTIHNNRRWRHMKKRPTGWERW